MDMLQSLEEMRKEISFSYELIYVDKYPILVKLYGERLPVLMTNDTELCNTLIKGKLLRMSVHLF
jgi:hypothetical protein